MLARQLYLFAALLSVSPGCGARKLGADYHVRLVVTNVPGDPLAGVTISLDGRKVGVTSDDGHVDLKLFGREGTRANLHIQCPPNHRQPAQPTTVALFDYATAGVPEVSAVCEQERVRQGIVVRSAGVSGLPFSLRGRPAGSTDAAGVAHVLAEGEPGETIDISFDTSKYPDLQPANPSVRLVLGNHDDAALAEQRFETKPIEPKHGKGRGKHSAPIARYDGPVRIR